jgi:hypothetical protein
MVVRFQPISKNNITGGGQVCENELPPMIVPSGEPVTGGTGQYTWLWEKGDSNGFSSAPGINNLSYYEPPVLRELAMFRRNVKSETCYSVSNEIEFRIKRIPQMILSPVGDTIDTGDSIVFNVSVLGTEPISYNWFHDTTLTDYAGGSELTIENAMPEDSGYYYCIIQNDCGMISSDSAYLSVLPVVSKGEVTDDKSGLLIYPNPVVNTLTIANRLPEIFKIIIYDSSGSLVFQEKNKKVINTSYLPTGIYLMKVTWPGRSGSLTGRFVIEK